MCKLQVVRCIESDLSISNVDALDVILWTLMIEAARKGRGFGFLVLSQYWGRFTYHEVTESSYRALSRTNGRHLVLVREIFFTAFGIFSFIPMMHAN